jgi:dTMP kinase
MKSISETTLMQRFGKLISVEGIDGSGKSTLISGLGHALTQKNIPVLLTKEPGGTQLGKSLRQILHAQKGAVADRAEFLLFAADRAHHFQTLVIPALQAGTVVIADRLADSSLAYQGYGRGLDRAMISTINQWAMQNVMPDLTVYLRLDPQIAAQRIAQRNEALTAFEQEKLDFWQRVAQGYEEIFRGRNNIIALDATLPAEELLQATLSQLLGKIS